MARVRSTIALAALRPIAADELPDMPIGEPRESTSFLATAIEFAIGWFKAHDQGNRAQLGAAILVSSQYPRRDANGLPGEVSTLLRQDFTGDHYGRVFVCNDTITFALELQSAPRDAVGGGRYVQQNNLGGLPTVILVPASRAITMYWHGLDDPDSAWELHVAPTVPDALTSQQLVSVLDAIWDETLASPQRGYNVLWKTREQHVAFGKVEKRVQDILTPMLRVALGTKYIVRPEDWQASGRLDFSIAPRSQGVTGVATIELKAICSRRESSASSGYRSEGPATHAKAIGKGVGQAIDAKKRLDADFSIVACYDLRMQPTASTAFSKAIERKASGGGIILRHYPLYPTAEARRSAEQAPVRRVAEPSPKSRRKK